MKNSVRLIGTALIVYATAVYLTRGFLPEWIPSTLTLLVLPLGLLALVLYWDLFSRARVPSTPPKTAPSSTRSLGYEVHQLTRRIAVATGSSSDYYNKVLLARLREAMVERASLETGMNIEHVRKMLADPKLARGFLDNDRLWSLLYYQGKSKGVERRRMLSELTDMIRDWTP